MSSGGGLTVSIVLPSVFPVLTNEIDRNDLRAADSSAILRDMSATLRTMFLGASSQTLCSYDV